MKVFGPPRPGISSPQFSNIRGAILTDRRIDYYIRAGFYGDEKRAELLESKKEKPKRKEKTLSVLQQALQNLGL